jgi:predicted transcriptional regulator
LKKETLLDVLFESEMRLNLLLLLKEEPKKLGALLTALDREEKKLISHIIILQDYYLIDDHSETYELTTIGKIIVDRLTPFLDRLDELKACLNHDEGSNIN